MVKPSHRREMAQLAKRQYGISVKLACMTFSISETCYRDEHRLIHKNQKIADWLTQLTATYRNWGFGVFFIFA